LDRRKKKDFWATVLFYLNILSWIILAFILYTFHNAQPEFESLFDRAYQLDLRTAWNIQFLYYLITVVCSGIVVSIAGALLAIFRGRRKSDYKKAPIIIGVISLVTLITALTVLK
jgi:hypothetical protein